MQVSDDGKSMTLTVDADEEAYRIFTGQYERFIE